jgi:hypothetical protein
MTDAEWADARFVGTVAIREFVTKAAKKKRSAPSRIAGQEKKENT